MRVLSQLDAEQIEAILGRRLNADEIREARTIETSSTSAASCGARNRDTADRLASP